MAGTPSRTTILVSIDNKLLARIDELVRHQAFASRSAFAEKAVKEKLIPRGRDRLAHEAGKLVPGFEVMIADEGLDLDQWPEY
jgi:metal-responsive CopG/Arc/MetJ family transcriptional regulator